MARGKPVVSTATEGGRLLGEPGRTGSLIEPGDVTALRAAIVEMLEARPQAQQMGRAGRVRVMSEFHVQGMVSAIQEIYNQL